jgi:formate hydrogenlyase subunit 4
MAHALFGLVQTLCLIGFAPLVQGIVKKVKALLQGRHGPPVLQPYYDLRKYFRKDEAVSEHASWLFLITPYVVFAATVTAATMIPAFMTQTLSDFTSDVVLVVFLFGLARFFTALSGIDTGSSFGAMGSSRDMFVSAFAEPTLFVTMLALALPFGTTNLTRIADEVASNRFLLVSPAFYMVFLAFLILVITETGRIPVDNPDTHLELTMIHEGMLLEYSGKRLGLMLWSAWIKQVLLFALLIDFCLPWGISTGTNGLMLATGLVFFVLKVLLVAVVVSCTEMSYAKIRFFRIPRLLSAAFALSILAIATESLL